MADVTISRNELEPQYPDLAEMFEEELRTVLSAIPGDPLTAEIRVDTTWDGALERAGVVVFAPDWMREWSLQFPVAPGDVRRSAVRAFSERRQDERRGGARRDLGDGERRQAV